MNLFRIMAILSALFVIGYFMNVSKAEGSIAIPAVNVKLKVRTLGLVNVSLTRERSFDVVKDGRYFQGTARFRSHTFPVAATEVNGVLSVTFPGKVTGSRKSRQRLYKAKLRSNSPKYKAKISSVPRSALPESACALGENKHVSHSAVVPELSVLTMESVKVLTVRAFTDPEWRFIHGALSDVEIASVLNTAEAIYNSQLGIRLRLVSITNFGDSTPELAPSDILSKFREHPEAQAESTVKSLFTGKDMTGATVGIAYIGSVCYASNYAYNVTQYYGLLTANIFTHELGHNLGAFHDYNNYGTLMYPSVSFGSIQFSPQSLGEITSFLNYFGSCLKTEETSPSLDGAVLSARKVRGNVSFVLTSAKGIAIGGKEIAYKVNGRKGSKLTSDSGEIKVRVRAKGKIKVLAYVKERPSITAAKLFRF